MRIRSGSRRPPSRAVGQGAASSSPGLPGPLSTARVAIGRARAPRARSLCRPVSTLAQRALRDGGHCPQSSAAGRGPAQAGTEGPLVPLATHPPRARTQRERPFSPASMESGSRRRILAVGTSGVHPVVQPPAPSTRLVVTEAGPFWKCVADVPVTLANPCLALVGFS